MVNFAQNLFDEFLFRVRRHKLQTIALSMCVLCGLIVGVVLYKIPAAYYWQNNRFAFACVLVYEGFFAVLLRGMLGLCIVLSCCVFSAMQPFLRSLIFVAALGCGMYVSGTVCALFQISLVVGLLYTLLFATVWLVSNLFLLIWCICEQPSENTFKQAICALKTTVCVYVGLFFVKILMIFLLLRPIYGLI